MKDSDIREDATIREEDLTPLLDVEVASHYLLVERVHTSEDTFFYLMRFTDRNKRPVEPMPISAASMLDICSSLHRLRKTITEMEEW